MRGATQDWPAELPEIRRLIDKGLSLTDMGDIYGVTRERMRQVIAKYGLARPLLPGRARGGPAKTELWCPWRPSICRECERPVLQKGLCSAHYGQARRRAWTPEQREAHKQRVSRWRAENPRNWTDVCKRARAAYKQRRRDAGLCTQCPTPAQPLSPRSRWFCEEHRAERAAQSLARYYAKQQRAA